jgi:hypothetical protein
MVQKKNEWLAIGGAEGNGQNAIDEERAEEPGGCLSLAQSTARRHSENDRDRARSRERKGDKGIDRILGGKIAHEVGRSRRRAADWLESHGISSGDASCVGISLGSARQV